MAAQADFPSIGRALSPHRAEQAISNSPVTLIDRSYDL